MVRAAIRRVVRRSVTERPPRPTVQRKVALETAPDRLVIVTLIS